RAPDVRLPITAGMPLFGHEITDPAAQQSPGFRVLVRLPAGMAAKRSAAALLPVMRNFEERIEHEANAKAAHPIPQESIQRELAAYRVALEPIGFGISRLRDQF